MAFRIYILPMEEFLPNKWRAKYNDTHLLGVEYATFDAGNERLTLLAARDIPLAQHQALVAEPDVVAFPEVLTDQIGAQLGTAQTVLENYGLPADWLQASFTWKQALRVLAAIFEFMQRGQVQGLAKLIKAYPLDTRYSQLPQVVRTQLQAVAQANGYDTSAVTSQSTLRQIFKLMADQTRFVEFFVGSNTV